MVAWGLGRERDLILKSGKVISFWFRKESNGKCLKFFQGQFSHSIFLG